MCPLTECPTVLMWRNLVVPLNGQKKFTRKRHKRRRYNNFSEEFLLAWSILSQSINYLTSIHKKQTCWIMASSTDPAPQMSEEVPADYDLEPLSRTSSQSAASLSNTTASTLPGAFNPTKYFFIHARGLPVVRVPGTPSHDTTIKITDSSGVTIFTSERPSRWSAVTSFHSARDSWKNDRWSIQ